MLIARSLVSALDSDVRPLNLESFNLPTIAQIVAGKLILSRSETTQTFARSSPSCIQQGYVARSRL